MIQTFDTLFDFMKQDNVQIDIIKNFKTKKFNELCYDDTMLYFDFDKQNLTIHRNSEDRHVNFKSPEVTMSFDEYIAMCKDFEILIE